MNAINTPLASVVIPVHNGELYLAEALDSVVAQNYENLEIIVVNDGSTDSTSNILKIYEGKSKKLKVVNVEKQSALGNVINIGVKASKGKYIVRMDADDVMLPGRIEEQVKFMEAHADVVAAGGQIDVIDPDGDKIRDRKYASDDALLKRNMFLFSPFAHPAVIMRKAALEEVGLYPEDLPKVEDTKLWFLLAGKGKFTNIDEKVLKYRVTFKSESLSKMVEHFKKTEAIRKWALKELNYKITLWQRIMWFVEKVGVRIASILPPRMFYWVYDVAKKVLE